MDSLHSRQDFCNTFQIYIFFWKHTFKKQSLLTYNVFKHYLKMLSNNGKLTIYNIKYIDMTTKCINNANSAPIPYKLRKGWPAVTGDECSTVIDDKYLYLQATINL